MKTYLISYDLRIPETSEDYKKVIDYIKSFQYWAKPLKSLWLVRTTITVASVRDEIMGITDKNDGILVMDITGDDWGTSGISTEVTEWMKKNV